MSRQYDYEQVTRVQRRSDAQLAHTLTQKLDAVWRHWRGSDVDAAFRHVEEVVTGLAHGQDDWNSGTLAFPWPWRAGHLDDWPAAKRNCERRVSATWDSVVALRDILGAFRFHRVFALTDWWQQPDLPERCCAASRALEGSPCRFAHPDVTCGRPVDPDASDRDLADVLEEKLLDIWWLGDNDEHSEKHVAIRVTRIAHGYDWADPDLDYRTPWSSLHGWYTLEDLTARRRTPDASWPVDVTPWGTYYFDPESPAELEDSAHWLPYYWRAVVHMRDRVGPDRFHRILLLTDISGYVDDSFWGGECPYEDNQP